VRRDDTGAEYAIRLLHSTVWECSCPAYRYNRARRTEGCRHIHMVRGMWQAMGLEDAEGSL
jgi:hypothetical protein